MASTIKVKRSSTASAVPSSLAEGELAANTTDGKLFLGKADTSVVQIGGLDPTGDSMTGDLNMQDNLLTRPKIKDYSMVLDDLGTASSVGVDWNAITSVATDNTTTDSTNLTTARGVTASPDGTKMYILDFNDKKIKQYSLSTAYDTSTASYVQASSAFTSDIGFSAGDIFIKPDGTKLWVVDTATDQIKDFDLSTAWDITTASRGSDSLSTTSYESAPTSLWFSPDGTKLMVAGRGSSKILNYTLSPAWDIGNATYGSQGSLVTETDPQGMAVSDDGLDVWIMSEGNSRIVHYNLSTAWTAGTASRNNYKQVTSYVKWGFHVWNTAGRWVSVGSPNAAYMDGTTATSNTAVAKTCDLTQGNVFKVTNVTGITFTFSNPPASGNAGSFVLELTDGGAGTVTWPDSVNWDGGSAPTLNPSGKNILSFYTRDGGTTWYGRQTWSSVSSGGGGGGGGSMFLTPAFFLVSGSPSYGTTDKTYWTGDASDTAYFYGKSNGTTDVIIMMGSLPSNFSSIDSADLLISSNSTSEPEILIMARMQAEGEAWTTGGTDSTTTTSSWYTHGSAHLIERHSITGLLSSAAADDHIVIAVRFNSGSNEITVLGCTIEWS